MGSQQLLDALTAHAALYHRSSSTPSSSSSNPNPNPRKSILRWFSTLSAHQRQSFLTIVDPDFVKVLLQMQKRLQTNGHGFFFLLPDMPSSSNPALPTLCFRRSRGLLARASAANSLEKSISEAVLMFGSTEGVKGGECLLDSLTVLEDFVKDVDRFVEVMDEVSDGGFLRGEVDGLGMSWSELPWLKDKGYYSLEAFVGNRLESALRISWMDNYSRAKKQRGAKSKAKAACSSIAANVFWRKNGCFDWFLGLDPGIRKKMFMTFLSKGAKSLVKEIVNCLDYLEDERFSLNSVSRLLPIYNPITSPQMQSQIDRTTDLEFSLHLMAESFFSRNSSFSNQLRELIVLQQITAVLLAHLNNELETKYLLFTTLRSAETIFDSISRRLREFLMVVSRESVELELVGSVKMGSLSNKSEEKLAVSFNKCKKKCRNPKKVNSTSKSSPTNNSASQDSCMERSVKTHQSMSEHIARVNGYMKSTACTLQDGIDSSKGPLAAEMVHARKKKNKRKGVKNKVSGLNNMAEVAKSPADTTETFLPMASTQEGDAELVKLEDGMSPVSNDITDHNKLQPLSFSSKIGNGLPIMSDTEVEKDIKMCSLSATDKHSKRCNQLESNSTSRYGSPYHEKKEEIITSRPIACNSTCCDRASRSPMRSNTTAYSKVVDSSICANQVCCTKEIADDRPIYANSALQPPLTGEALLEAANDDSSLSDKESSGYYPHSPTISVGVTSYEWPNLTPTHFSHPNSNYLPAATDRYHLDVAHWPNHICRSYYSPKHQIGNASAEHGCSRVVPSLSSPMSLDCPPMIRGCTRLSQSGNLNYDSVYNSRLHSSLCTGITDPGMQLTGACSDSEWKYSGDIIDCTDYKNTSDFMDDTESNWMSGEESDLQTTNGRDYNKFFGGGVMYWNTSDHVGTNFSRPPSHSSEDSCWAWYEADLNRAIDDMVEVSSLPAYSTNGLASSPTATFCSPFDSLGPGQQSPYAMSGNEVNAKAFDSQCSGSGADVLEENISTSKTASASVNEAVKGDSFPYPILRPIIIPSVSMKGSSSEIKFKHDHVSPCVSSARRELPRIKRPPSPVVLCVTRAPRVPPPPGSRKQRGFPVVRSGSSSPRHWGMRNLRHEESNLGDANHCFDCPEVVWASWGNKDISNNPIIQPIPGSLLQDRLIAISQLARDQEHPDVAFPLRPPDTVNCPSQKASLSVIHNLLQEEIFFFCKQIATENQNKKPFINWAVKRVARSLQVLWPRSRTSVFGSNATGLALPTSDVDLVVCLPPVRNLEPIKEAGILEGRNGIKETCLQHAARYLANQEWVKNDSLKTIENTAIPLIMLVAEVPRDIMASSGNTSNAQRPGTMDNCSTQMCSKSINDDAADVKSIRLDISFKSSSHTGLQTTELVRELTEQFPASIPLALVLKQFLADRSLDHSYSGGLSSYCLVLLITRFLQHEHHIGRPFNQNLGSLLMDFLYFFGNIFDPRQIRVSIQGSGLYTSRERGIDPIHIDDPLCPTNNVGRNCFRIHQCIKAFQDAYSILESELSSFSGIPDPDAHASFKLLRKIIPSLGLNRKS